MFSSVTLPPLARTLLYHALLFAMIQVALSVSRIYSVLPGFRLLGIVTSVPGPETAFSCCIECARDPANCDANHFNTLTGACEFVDYGGDKLSLEAAPEWVLHYYGSIPLIDLTFANASQSTDWVPNIGPARNAIDGNRAPYFDDGSCTSTGNEDWSAWWQVDLTAEMHVLGMLIWNRLDEGFVSRLENLVIYVAPTYEGLGDARYMCGDLPDPPAPYPTAIVCARIMAGRFIRIHKTEDRILHLCEVELMLA